jgi:hypothetical protein
MGVACSREGRFQLVPYLINASKSIVGSIGSTNQPEKVYDWLQQIKSFPTVQYDERPIGDSLSRITAIFKIGQQVCQWKSDADKERAFFLEIHTNVCKRFLTEGYIKSLIADKEYYMVLSVVVPKEAIVSPNPTTPKKTRYLKTAAVCATMPIEKVGVSIAFYSILPYVDFLKESPVLKTKAGLLLSQTAFQSPPRIKNVCSIALLCSNNNGGATVLNFIKDCNRKPEFEMYALNAIPSAYSYYLLYGFKRSNNQRDFYPVWYDATEKVYYYDVESMSPDVFDRMKETLQTPENSDVLNGLAIFRDESSTRGFLLTRLVKSSVPESASVVGSPVGSAVGSASPLSV